MPSPIQIRVEHIAALDAGQLQGLLNKLLYLEAFHHGIPLSGVHGTDPARITVADGGRDGKIEWTSGPDRTDFFPGRVTAFQCKAEAMSKAKCFSEMLMTDRSPARKRASVNKRPTKNHKAATKRDLKPEVAAALDAGGAYVMFCNQSAEGKMHTDRLRGMRSALKEAGRTDHDHACVGFYDATKIVNWVNQYPTAICWVREQRGLGDWSYLQTWESWSGNSDIATGPFIADAAITAQVEGLKVFMRPARSVARMIGLSGLGKSRLAFEALRPPPDGTTDAAQQALSESVLYVRAAAGRQLALSFADLLRREKLPVLLVVDDCEASLHQELTGIARHADSRFRLLTLDFDPVRHSYADQVVTLARTSTDVIRSILEHAHPNIAKADLDRIIRFSQGYPRIAVELGQAVLSGEGSIAELNDDVLLKKMVWGRGAPNDTALRVLRICSVFSSLGIEEEVEYQLEAAAILVGVPKPDFQDQIVNFSERGIIQRRGRFIRVEPLPVALRLASDWWKGRSPQDVRTLIDTVRSEMVESMCEQLRLLSHLDKAKAIAADLCGDSAPFGSAEVLNTETGSRCFRALVEVNPEATLQALERVFGGLSAEQLRSVDQGRREIVWALERLVFRKETFARAARLLLLFATAETERWSNNATGQFLQLFHAYLPGTEASLDDRTTILEEQIRSQDPAVRSVIVNALDHALETNHYTRTSGAEEQGSGPSMRDYEPTGLELAHYWDRALEMLADSAAAQTEEGVDARNLLAGRIRGLIGHGRLDAVEAAVNLVLTATGNYWPRALESVSEALEYEGSGMPPEYLQRVTVLRNKLMPTSLRDRIRLLVSEFPWGLFPYEEGVTGTPLDKAAKALRELAEECSHDEATLYACLPDLMRGEQRNCFEFGMRLGEVLEKPKPFIDATKPLLSLTGANPAVYATFLRGLAHRNRPLVDETLDELSVDAALIPILPYITSMIPIEVRDLQRLITLITAGKLEVERTGVLSYGSVLKHLTPEDIRPLLRALVDAGDGGAWTALQIGAMYVHGSPERRDALVDVFMVIIKAAKFPSDKSGRSMDVHQYGSIANWLMKDSKCGPVAARHLARIIVELCRRKRFPYDFSHMTHSIVTVMLQTHLDEVWPIFAKAVERHDALFRLHVGNVLGGGMKRGEQESKNPISLIPISTLISWCERYIGGASFLLRIAGILAEGTDAARTWSPLVSALLQRFGDDDGVLGELAANMHTFSWSGSLIPYWEQYLAPLDSLKKHQSRNVRRWAARMTTELQKQIANERKREAERDFGIY